MEAEGHNAVAAAHFHTNDVSSGCYYYGEGVEDVVVVAADIRFRTNETLPPTVVDVDVAEPFHFVKSPQVDSLQSLHHN